MKNKPKIYNNKQYAVIVEPDLHKRFISLDTLKRKRLAESMRKELEKHVVRLEKAKK